MALKSSLESLAKAPALQVRTRRSQRFFSLCISSLLQFAFSRCISVNLCCLISAMVSHGPDSLSSSLSTSPSSGFFESFELCRDSAFFALSLHKWRFRLWIFSLGAVDSILWPVAARIWFSFSRNEGGRLKALLFAFPAFMTSRRAAASAVASL